MLQRYKFVAKSGVHQLQKDIEVFITRIKSVGASDNFDPDIYFPPRLANKAKKKIMKITRGKKVRVHNVLYLKTQSFFDKYKVLGRAKTTVNQAFIDMNEINGMLDCTYPRVCLQNLPLSIRDEAKKLFVFLYEETLSTYGIKQHYKDFCNLQSNIWCPFCGIETLEDYTFIKEDYDHLLAKSIYPFAAVNMRNLAPMGKKCNRTHKGKKDLIWDGTKQLKSINPYRSKVDISIDFSGSTLPNSHNKKGKWALAVLPNRVEVNQWDCVYNITERIIKEYFVRGKRPDIETWIIDFINIHHKHPSLVSIKSVRAALKKYGIAFENDRFKEGRYVKASTFKWISSNASDVYVQSLVSSIQAP